MITGLEEKEIELLNTVFKRFTQIEKVFLFGSRAKGNYRKNSDVDLVLLGECDNLLAENVAMQLYELPLPYKFDVQIYANIRNIELKEHIDRVGIVIYFQ